MLIVNGGSVGWGYCVWQWGGGYAKRGGKLANLVLHDILKPYTKVQV